MFTDVSVADEREVSYELNSHPHSDPNYAPDKITIKSSVWIKIANSSVKQL